MKYIRSGGWRNDVFMNEPGRGPAASTIGNWADCMTTLARNDDDFAARYGSIFHRDQMPVAPTSGGRSRRVSYCFRPRTVLVYIRESYANHMKRGQNPPPAPVPFMELAQLRAAGAAAVPPPNSQDVMFEWEHYTVASMERDMAQSDEDMGEEESIEDDKASDMESSAGFEPIADESFEPITSDAFASPDASSDNNDA